MAEGYEGVFEEGCCVGGSLVRWRVVVVGFGWEGGRGYFWGLTNGDGCRLGGMMDVTLGWMLWILWVRNYWGNEGMGF